MKLKLIIIGLVFAAIGCTQKKQINDPVKTSGEIPPLVLLCQNIDYSDTAVLHSEEFMTQTMTDIVKLMSAADSTSISDALSIFFSGIRRDEKALRQAGRFADLYLNNPSSPVRNENLYILFLKSMLSSDSIPEHIMLQNEARLRKASLNRPGMIANDFNYIDRTGQKGSLHRFKAPETLLIFYDPECTHCSDILNTLAENPEINGAIARGDLAVLAIYAEGKREIWEQGKNELPTQWNVGYDLTGILDKELYDLPAMPTIYVLDEHHRVVLKDPEVENL